jgi:hypothetical protein
MTVLHCDRCGSLFDPDGRFMTVDVDVLGTPRETLGQVLLCASCTDEVGDELSLETVIHEGD